MSQQGEKSDFSQIIAWNFHREAQRSWLLLVFKWSHPYTCRTEPGSCSLSCGKVPWLHLKRKIQHSFSPLGLRYSSPDCVSGSDRCTSPPFFPSAPCWKGSKLMKKDEESLKGHPHCRAGCRGTSRTLQLNTTLMNKQVPVTCGQETEIQSSTTIS